jgi:hypothetical protein
LDFGFEEGEICGEFNPKSAIQNPK